MPFAGTLNEDKGGRESCKKLLGRDKYSTGISSIDEKHQRLFELINQLLEHQACSVHSHLISDILNDLVDYARTHFQDEERVMQENNYPRLAAHREQHRAFIKKVATFCNATTLKVDEVPQILTNYLCDWLTTHILQEDLKIKHFLAEEETDT